MKTGAWVSHLVLAEAAWVLDAVYERGPAEVAKACALDSLATSMYFS